MGSGVAPPLWPPQSFSSIPIYISISILNIDSSIQAKVRIRTGVVLLCRQLRSRSATLAVSIRFYTELNARTPNVEPRCNTLCPFIKLCETRYRPNSAERCGIVSSRGLNTSLPWCVHPGSIKLVFYKYPKRSLFGYGFGLRCFQPLSVSA